ncbi:MAG: peptide-methionine (S)-S-oxide reductase, partial [Gemmatimonadaceae bacterium]
MKPTMPALLVAVAAATVFAIAPKTHRATDAAHFPAPAVDASRVGGTGEQIAYFAGGCFWGVEAVYEHVKGVKGVTSGYAGGSASRPSYEEVSSGQTGHAESVKVVYDPSQVSYG